VPKKEFLISYTRVPIARVTYSVIPAKAGIQNGLKNLDSGSPPAFAGVARNDNFSLGRKFCKRLKKKAPEPEGKTDGYFRYHC